ncbi:hypothetical protein TCA2_4508 [Paenibacillus sp. TCA20]|uniref:hypothetical protein n=1 Tax=Paenibacillus sp. TCA20 TaxID=1499968 RepID=UPI0004D7F231|nr:hypothetical protein [Paenibacillus sp. TCA20]GAK42016.1 hypothetical protein TCA2_4508 [Paenibacillus sp. TCA20]
MNIANQVLKALDESFPGLESIVAEGDRVIMYCESGAWQLDIIKAQPMEYIAIDVKVDVSDLVGES